MGCGCSVPAQQSVIDEIREIEHSNQANNLKKNKDKLFSNNNNNNNNQYNSSDLKLLVWPISV